MKEYRGHKPLAAPATCPVCGRTFIPATCYTHCEPRCCRSAGCLSSQKPDRRASKRCCVCGKSGLGFVRFAPCDKTPGGCKGMFYQSEYGRQWGCFSEGEPADIGHCHNPKEKPRFHIKYCSLECYNGLSTGHQRKVQAAWRRKWYKSGQARREERRELKACGLLPPGK